MNAFTIDAENNITVHASKKAARATGAGVFDTAESLATLIGPDHKRLVEIWNSLTGVTPVKKFASLAVATKRIFAEARKLTGPATEVAGTTEPAPSALAAASTKAHATRRTAAPASAESKNGSKKQILLGLISRKNGASLEELTTALAWQKHSVRGFITTLRRTINIESFKTDEGVRTYRTSQTA